MKSTVKEKARIFLTDYASYNNGTQFEFGHWVDLDQFDSSDDLILYIKKHFEEADKKSPLPCGTQREEIMITDFEGFPESLYSESMDFDQLFNYFDAVEDSSFDLEVIEAYAELGSYSLNDLDAFFEALKESYYGKFSNDEEFAEDTAENFGFEQPNEWPYNCIDWERAARDLMIDFNEQDGHYFRSI